ncbi:MAG: flagellar biosynthesis protein FlhA [Candidatus Methylomirabilales bacterium]
MDTHRAAFGNLIRQSDLLTALTVFGILAVLLIPLPSFAMDLLITFSFTFSILTLLVSLYILRPLEFSVFPSLLLIVTLFRLSLNVASSRLILLHGDKGSTAAGKIIGAFGQFVVGGNYVVGAVVFVILVVIQFVVITKGAGRIAEVAARFTLDALPGKQMSIDADLNAGLISEAQTQTRRLEIAREADFYGAMDGASKFIRGDAVAGIIITLINILGGLVIGVFQLGLPVKEALETYTLLTIGDGLVVQIPAMLVSTGAGMVVTRAASDTEFGRSLASQLLITPAPAITAAVLVLLGFMPGLPTLPFLLLAAVTGSVAYSSLKGRFTSTPVESKKETAVTPAEHLEQLLGVDPLEVDVGYALIPLVDPAEGGGLLPRIKLIRRQFATDLGFVVPPVRVRDNLQLAPESYAIKVRGLEVATGQVRMDLYLAVNPGTLAEAVEGLETKEPASGLPALWIASDQRERVQALGYAVMDPASVIATHLTEVIRTHARDLLGRQEVQSLLDTLRTTHPAVVEGVVPALIPLGTAHRVLQNLLAEGIPIRDLPTIMEALADAAPVTKDPGHLAEHVRQALAKTICRNLLPADGVLKVLTLSPATEDLITQALEGERGPLTFEPRLAQRIIQGITHAVEPLRPQGALPTLMCSPSIRRPVRSLLEQHLPELPVLSFAEVAPQVNIRSVGIVEVNHAD